MLLERNIWLLKLYECFRACLFFLPIVTIYYSQQKGVEIDGFYITESAFAFAIVVMIVPVGYISDIWKRRNVLLIGAVISVLGFTVELLGYGLRDMFLGEVLVGIGFACCNATITSIAHDSLAEMNREGLQAKLQGQLSICSFAPAALASVLGSWFYTLHADLPMFLTVIAGLGCIVCALLMVEPERIKEPVKFNPVKDIYETMKYALHGHKEVACIIFMMVIVFTMTKLSFWTHQPYYQQVGIPIEYFGWLIAGGLLSSSVGSWLSYALEPKLKPVYTVMFIIFFPIIGYGFSGYMPAAFMALLIISMGAVIGFAKPVIDHAINKRVGSSRRSTVHAAKAVLYNLLFMVTAPFVGIYAKQNGAADTFVMLSAVLLVFAVPVLWCLKKHKVI